MEFFLWAFILLSFLMALHSIKITKTYFNPVFMVFIFFFIFLAFNRMKLSGLQAGDWIFPTYLTIFYIFCSFVLFPYFFILYNRRRFRFMALNYRHVLGVKSYTIYIVVFLSAILQLYINKIISGYFFPILNLGNIDVQFHIEDIKQLGPSRQLLVDEVLS